MKVAQRIKEIVDDKGVTYTSISSKTGITVNAISQSFAGKRKLSADEMIAICKALNIDLVDLQNCVSLDGERKGA